MTSPMIEPIARCERCPDTRRQPARLRRTLLALVAAGLTLLAAAGGASAATPSVFGAGETYSNNLSNFPKWRGVVQRFSDEMASCPQGECDKPTWAKFVDSLRGYDLMTQVKTVHTRLNDKRYILDIVNWGLNDYWATPFQFMRKNGDCEDYAIGKYMVLRALGVPMEQMRIVVLMDLNLNLVHAVLVINVDGQSLLLDNQIRGVVPVSTVRHYQPYYSLNENGWWMHKAS
jgi:predicted transglutaminase-like cysteine proteinase